MKIYRDILHPRSKYNISSLSALFFLIFLAYLYALAVYLLPLTIDNNLDNSFDAFSYAYAIYDDNLMARESQRFLSLYPQLSVESVFLYAPLLNISFLIPSLIVMRINATREEFLIFIACLTLPESLIFLGGVSKEGLGIAAATSVISGLTLLAQGKKRVTGFFMCILGVSIAELSRPFFGLVFGFAVLLAALPLLSVFSRKLVYFFCFVFTALILWAILLGPYSDDFSTLYHSAREFVQWFESEMGSESYIKSAVRQFFSAAFSSDDPTLATILLIFLAGFIKSIVYLLAIPLISPPNFTTIPAQIWAATWQVAVSLSSIFIGVGIWRLRRKLTLSLEDKCRLTFSLSLIFLIAISTAIFHVRYRAPGVIVLLLALWMAMPMRKIHILRPTFFVLGTTSLIFISMSSALDW